MCHVEPWGRFWWTLWTCTVEVVRVSLTHSLVYHHLEVSLLADSLQWLKWNTSCQFLHWLVNVSPGPSQVLQVADALCTQLSKELPGEEGGWGGGKEGGGGRSGLSGDDRQAQDSLSYSHSQQSSSANPLLISCWAQITLGQPSPSPRLSSITPDSSTVQLFLCVFSLHILPHRPVQLYVLVS